MKTIELTDALQKKTDEIIQAAPDPLVLLDFLVELIGHDPSEEQLREYVASVESYVAINPPTETELFHAVALQRHKLIEYSAVSDDKSICELEAALPFLSPWEHRVYCDEIIARLSGALPRRRRDKVIESLQEASREEFPGLLRQVIEKYL